MCDGMAVEVAVLKRQMEEIQKTVQLLLRERNTADSRITGKTLTDHPVKVMEDQVTMVSYSGRYEGLGQDDHWEHREQTMDQLLKQSGEKMSKVLTALGSKQRLEILRAVLQEPLTGAELLDYLKMGTTGQLYHHLKALQGADLLAQGQGGRYHIPPHRVLPFLLLLAASSELLETSDYMGMTEVRDNPSAYLGKVKEKYDPHLLLWAIVENSIHEHLASHCDEVNIFLHGDGSATVADNGRGIPTKALPHPNKTVVQSTLTDLDKFKNAYKGPDTESGISIAVVNALSQTLIVEIRREGTVSRQEHRHGIPQSGLNVIGITKESGTSITFQPNGDLFDIGFDRDKLYQQRVLLKSKYPGLSIQIHGNKEEPYA
jgi:DNA gyrase subunit B